jgi:hypothetical protein
VALCPVPIRAFAEHRRSPIAQRAPVPKPKRRRVGSEHAHAVGTRDPVKIEAAQLNKVTQASTGGADRPYASSPIIVDEDESRRILGDKKIVGGQVAVNKARSMKSRDFLAEFLKPVPFAIDVEGRDCLGQRHAMSAGGNQHRSAVAKVDAANQHRSNAEAVLAELAADLDRLIYWRAAQQAPKRLEALGTAIDFDEKINFAAAAAGELELVSDGVARPANRRLAAAFSCFNRG